MSIRNWTEDQWHVVLNALTTLTLLAVAAPLIWFALAEATRKPEPQDAYILTKQGDAQTVSALWQYQQLKMDKCAWCGRTVNMNRHHVIPQAANPALRDVKENLVVLCRDCHFVLGHRCNWKKYNPDVLYICTHYTNCVKSADTRKTVDAPKETVETPAPVAGIPDTRNILHVTNDVPDKQKAALERILKWNNGTTNNAPFRSTPSTVR